MLTIDQLRIQYEQRAENERQAGGFCKIDLSLRWIDIKLSDGSEWHFQEWQADELLDTVPEFINAEDFLLATAQSW